MDEVKARNIHNSAELATVFLKSLANKNRLVVLCALVDGEKNVSELTEILGIRQPTLSQQLARLRADEMVATRRDQNRVYYRLQSDEAELVMGLVFELFCAGSDLELPESRRRRRRNEEAIAAAAE